MSRTRTRNLNRAGGSWSRYTHGPDPGYETFCFSEKSTCTDETLAGDGHPFSVYKTKTTGGLINRPWTGYYTSQFNNWVADALRVDGTGGHGHGTVPNVPSNGAAATEAVKKTNPSRAIVDIPISIAEMVEIPRLIKGAGDTALKAVARGSLGFHFAFSPLIGDLLKSFEFQRHFANRVKELKRLRKGGRGRTVSTFSGTVSGSFNWTVQSSGVTIRVPCNWTTNHRQSVFVPWIPGGKEPETDEQMMRTAIHAVLGLTADTQTLWELIPWSWLIDWFSNAGDYFAAHRNIVDMSAGTCQVMNHVKTHSLVSAYNDGVLSMSSAVCETESKQRSLSSPSFSAQLPFLSARQLSILGSLSVLRHRRRG